MWWGGGYGQSRDLFSTDAAIWCVTGDVRCCPLVVYMLTLWCSNTYLGPSVAVRVGAALVRTSCFMCLGPVGGRHGCMFVFSTIYVVPFVWSPQHVLLITSCFFNVALVLPTLQLVGAVN